MSNKVNANPTKGFFITMLTKDISLIDAITDLVDNSVDGAINRKGKNGDYKGLRVDLIVNEDSFSIIDNCGGFSAEIAAKYAFRFGRTDDAENKVEGSVGTFGVGMKRALFKIGRNFSVKSVCEKSEFTITVDVDEWKKDKNNDWKFEFDHVTDQPSTDDFGTETIITELHSEVSGQFKNENFITKLKKEIKLAHEKMLERGLMITINEDEIEFTPSYLLISTQIKPAYRVINIDNIQIKIYVGITERGKPKDAGWYIYCNQRLILEADQTYISGWGDGGPGFHNTFARFRGYVFIDSDDADLLPWNTTKSGVDHDSLLYRGIRLEMIKMGKPVIDFLKDLVKENQEDDEETIVDETLNDMVNCSKKENITSINVEQLTNIFQAPQLVRVRKPQDTQKIQYAKSISDISKVRQILKVTTLKEIGEKTFEYYYKMECED